jgi:hypothetical protein
MRDERLEVSVTFDGRRGYVATAPELRQPVTALSLGGLRKRIEALMLPDDVALRLVLDRAARQERDRRRRDTAGRERLSLHPRPPRTLGRRRGPAARPRVRRGRPSWG